MSKRAVQKLKKIPSKKRPRGTSDQFDLDKYIEDHITSYSEEFKQQAKQEYSLLDKLTDDFTEFLEKGGDLPFKYEHDLDHYQLRFLEKEAINTFKKYVVSKGYTCEYTSKDMDPNDYYPWTRGTITVK